MLQLGVILFCVMAIPTAILMMYSGAQILQYSETAIAESSLAGLNANRKLNENALNNLAQNTVRLTANKIFDRIRNFETYAKYKENYNNVSQALLVLRELVNLNHRVDGVYSSYFYLSGADYVVSTDKGITTLDRYEPIGWMEKALNGHRGISGVWYPRRLSTGETVISYVLPLNRLSTTTRGTIVVNLRENQIGEYLRSSEPGEDGYLLVDEHGTIISHHDKSLLLTDGTKLPFIQEIQKSLAREGYSFHELNDERQLYTWSRSDLFGWWNINIYSMDTLMTKTHKLQHRIILLTAMIIFAGTVLTVFLATWLSKPVRELVRTLRARGKPGSADKNELAFLDAVFRRMQEEEEELYKLLQEREQDTRSLAIHRLLDGEVGKPIADLFPEPYFWVAALSIDRYRQYENQTNPETRSYHRYHLISQCDSLFPSGIYARCVYQGEGCFAIVINLGQKELEKGCEEVRKTLTLIADSAAELLGHSVTIGVSSHADTSSMIQDRVAEAMEVMKYRMMGGKDRIFFWKPEAERSKNYIYPANSERRIINFLDLGDLGSIMKELAIIRNEIQSAQYISFDNIMFIYNQLIGVTIKHLTENHISTSRIFAGRGNLYSAIASIDTLDELEEYLGEFFQDIIQYLARNPGVETGYGERIIRYLEEHFREEIVFEEMAKDIGISYSYMRKLAYELTGKSMIDYVNQLRIEKAKRLLLETRLNIKEVASEVGYYNVQSFNRFFRKFEGMPPSSYRMTKTKSS